MEPRRILAAALGSMLLVPAIAGAQDADVSGGTAADASTLVAAIGEMASADVAGAICADERYREAVVLATALLDRERRLRAAVARHDGTAERRERAVLRGLHARIVALHADAASCVGEALPPPAREDTTPFCVLEISPDVPTDAMRVVGDAPRSAVRE